MSAIDLIFRKFAELVSARQVYLTAADSARVLKCHGVVFDHVWLRDE